MKYTVFFCLGVSGSGKSHFINTHLSDDMFYKLKSVTTRPMRPNEQDGREYYFISEKCFDEQELVTRLWVNEAFWTPEKPKWLYGVPEFEVMEHRTQHLIYDVIQPKYARQMIDWFQDNMMANKYDFKTIYFIPPTDRLKTVIKRANMPDDLDVRKDNTCDPIDFLRAGLDMDFLVKSSAEETIIPNKLTDYLNQLRTQNTTR